MNDPAQDEHSTPEGPGVYELRLRFVAGGDEEAERFGSAWAAACALERDGTYMGVTRVQDEAFLTGEAGQGMRGPTQLCGCTHCDEERRTGLPFPANVMRGIIVCDQCGNKRCPKATHHDEECSGSNARGQVGSAYGPASEEG